jgi:serine/threonine-protein kinase
MAALADDRDLLFGLLALQNGLIDQGQLVAAFQAWTRDKGRALADHLQDRGDLDADDRSAVKALVERHIKKHGGDVERSLAAIPAGRSTRESLARIDDPDVGGTLAHLGSASTQHGEDADRTASYAVGTASYAVGTATSEGQRFRILRPHARGGLGAVFVALDSELHREVALKQILDAQADDPTSRTRFLLEAEITGGLEHPGIVPIYGLGTYGDGRPFYVMRFIRGDSLKEAIEHFHTDGRMTADPGGRSLELRKLLRRFLDVCNAIEYAHSRGVLHRDIKPGNIIVGKHGETLVVDWGLAKARGRADTTESSEERPLVPSSASGSAETLPGSALGTPAYMSPEQARGDLEALGPRSDVYSLGATLYCLLIGRAPVEGSDLGAVLRAVQQGGFPPPRSRDPSLDTALEAVCLKAMAVRPQDRYGSPKALAEDVERRMADEPVSAWREPLARRARRWARRNRTAATAAAVALVAGVLGLAGVLAVQTKAKADLADANAELTRSKAAVQARYELAVEAIKIFHTGVSEDFLLKQDQFRALRDRLLRSAADFYGKLGALLGKETDMASRRALAASNFELADLIGKVGRSQDALAAHRRVLAYREALANDPGTDADVRADVGRSLLAIGLIQRESGRMEDALTSYRQAESRLATLARSSPESPPIRAALAHCRARLGWLMHLRGQTGDGLALIRQALADQEAVAGDETAPSELRSELALIHNRIAIILQEAGLHGGAMEEYRAALAIWARLIEAHSEKTQFRAFLAMVQENIGLLLSDTGRPSEAEAEFRAALAIQQRLADDNPADTKYRIGLAVTHRNLGWLLSRTGKLMNGEAEFRAALAIDRRLADDNPADTGFRASLATTHNSLGDVLAQTGRPSEAEAEFRAALAIQQGLADDNPTELSYQCDPASSLARIGKIKQREGWTSEAVALFRRAVALMERFPTDSAGYLYNLACYHALLAGVAAEPGSGMSAAEGRAEADRAMDTLQRAVAMGYRGLVVMQTDTDLNPLRDREDFRQLMLDLAMPADPFAWGR